MRRARVSIELSRAKSARRRQTKRSRGQAKTYLAGKHRARENGGKIQEAAADEEETVELTCKTGVEKKDRRRVSARWRGLLDFPDREEFWVSWGT